MMAGGPVNWILKLQPIVTVSSMEAENHLCFYAIQNIVQIRQQLKDIDLKRTRLIKVLIDIQLARQVAMNPVHHLRSKHKDIKRHWIRDMVAFKKIELFHVSTTGQREDFLIKILPGNVFWRHVVPLSCMHVVQANGFEC